MRVPVVGIGPACMDWDMISDILGAADDVSFESVDRWEDCESVAPILFRVAARHLSTLDVAEVVGMFQHPTVLLLSDEEGVFDVDLFCEAVPQAKVFIQTPHLDRTYPDQVVGYLPVGYSRAVRAHSLARAEVEKTPPAKTMPVSFSGQVTHPRREVWAEAMERLEGLGISTDLMFTDGFMKGVSQESYAHTMAAAEICPAPPGPVTPDTFRFWEALELGGLPVAEDREYWNAVFPEGWRSTTVDTVLSEQLVGDPPPVEYITATIAGRQSVGEPLSTIAGCAYLEAKWRMRDEIKRACGSYSNTKVFISASPVKSHPDSSMLTETVMSARRQLPDSTIFVLFDGVREEQLDLGDAYYEHVREIVWRCRTDPAWANVVPVFDGFWRHQALTFEKALMRLTHLGDLVLFMEHDTPFLDRWIDWEACAVEAQSGRIIRFHFMQIPEEHEYLMRGNWGAVFIQTVQWSQRPHLVRADVYAGLLERHFTSKSRTMIEDVLYSPFSTGAEHAEILIYAREADIAYTGHTDGRAGDEKFSMWVTP